MTTYRGVKCKTPDCENLIALGTFTQIQNRRVEFAVILKPLQILCERCHQTHSYDNPDMVQFEGATPAAGLANLLRHTTDAHIGSPWTS